MWRRSRSCARRRRSSSIDFANLLDANADPASIGFELRFAGAARADAAAEARQRRASADQPRQQVFELRELDLPLAFARARTPREDVENELRAVDDLPLDARFDLAQLRRRQLVVEDDGVDVGLGAGGRQEVELAAPEKRRGIGRGRSCDTRSTTCPPAA